MINPNEVDIGVLDFLFDILGYTFLVADGKITEVIPE